jgi:hypothetical protein
VTSEKTLLDVPPVLLDNTTMIDILTNLAHYLVIFFFVSLSLMFHLSYIFFTVLMFAWISREV